jgi:Zinc carboxypeptidase
MKKRILLSGLALWLCATHYVLAQIDFTQYHTPASLASDLSNLGTTHPALSQAFTIGTSIESRSIQGIKISANPGVDDPAKGDVVASIHRTNGLGSNHSSPSPPGERATADRTSDR